MTIRIFRSDMPAIPKPETYRSEAWRKAVAQLPCAWCMRAGPSQAAHANHLRKGMGSKADDCFCMPLCPTCHTEFDQGSLLTKLEKRAMADQWILATVRRLALDGVLKVTT